ncbi:MAG: peroxiredoxin [Chlamydiae bacterium]|nr:peroxiredoxin [Chlamydiota bacterium]
MASLVGKKAPHFSAKAVQKDRVIENFSLENYLGHYVIFFFYPLDFTFVCPTELHAFQSKLHEFEKRNARVVACSIDSHFSHFAWLSTPKKQGGILGVEYPIVSDIQKSIAKDYGVLCQDEGIAYRGVFLIDKQGIVRHQTINDLPIGRSIEEELRSLEALIFFERNGEVCPADWREGEKGMKPSFDGVKDFFSNE